MKKRLPNLGGQFLAARSAAACSQADLVRSTGLARPTVAKAEQGAGQLRSFLQLLAAVECVLVAGNSTPPDPVGSTLEASRIRLGLSRLRVAEQSGISAPTVAAIEANADGVHVRAVAKLALALSVQLEVRSLGTKGGFWPVAFSSENDTWQTPAALLERLYRVLGAFDLDPCSPARPPAATPVQAGRYYTKADNGLALPWEGSVYMNPPYGRSVTGLWTAKAAQEVASGRAKIVVGLLPARPGSAWWHDTVAGHACVLLLRGRLTFVGADSAAPFPSALVVWGGDPFQLARLRQEFAGAQYIPAWVAPMADAAD